MASRKVRVEYAEDFIVHVDRRHGEVIEVDADEWREFQALRRRFLALNNKFCRKYDKALWKGIKKRPKVERPPIEWPEGTTYVEA